MLRMDLQFFAHKKGVGSTKNGRDSESKRLGAKKSRRTVCKSRKHPLQTARNKNSSGCECRTRWRRHFICISRWCCSF